MQVRLRNSNAAEPGDFLFTQVDITRVSCIKTVDFSDIQFTEIPADSADLEQVTSVTSTAQ